MAAGRPFGGRGTTAPSEPDCVLEKRRVVITGLGAITPLGNTREAFWEALIAGRSGVGPITAFDSHKLTTQIAAEVKDFDPDAVDRAQGVAPDGPLRAVRTGRGARGDGGCRSSPTTPRCAARTGAIVASGIGGIITVENTTFEVGPQQKWDRISPFFVPMLMANAASAHISMAFGLRGPVFAVASACASAQRRVRGGVRQDRPGRRDRGRHRRQRSDGDPDRDGRLLFDEGDVDAQRRPDRTRRGRSTKSATASCWARARGSWCSRIATSRSRAGRASTPRCWATVNRPTRITSRSRTRNREGVVLAMERALQRSGVTAEQIGYVNAHGTSTPLGDLAESQAIERVFGDHAHNASPSRRRSRCTGTLLGAAGAIEGDRDRARDRTTASSHRRPTTKSPIPSARSTTSPTSRARPNVEVAMSNGFGFGGHNTSVVFGRHAYVAGEKRRARLRALLKAAGVARARSGCWSSRRSSTPAPARERSLRHERTARVLRRRDPGVRRVALSS